VTFVFFFGGFEVYGYNDHVQKSVSVHYRFYIYHDSKFFYSTIMAVGDTDFCASRHFKIPLKT